MGYLVLRLCRFHPPDEEEIISLLNKKRLDPDLSVQTIKKHTAECVVYEIHSPYSSLHKGECQQLLCLDSVNHVAENISQEVEYEQVSVHNMTYNVEIMLQKIYVPVQRKNCSYYQVIIWLLILEIMLQKKSEKVSRENTLPLEESQLLPYHNLAFHYRNHVAENTFPMVEYLQLPSRHLIS